MKMHKPIELDKKEKDAVAALKALTKRNPGEIPRKEDLAAEMGIGITAAYTLWRLLQAKRAFGETLEFYV